MTLSENIKTIRAEMFSARKSYLDYVEKSAKESLDAVGKESQQKAFSRFMDLNQQMEEIQKLAAISGTEFMKSIGGNAGGAEDHQKKDDHIGIQHFMRTGHIDAQKFDSAAAMITSDNSSIALPKTVMPIILLPSQENTLFSLFEARGLGNHIINTGINTANIGLPIWDDIANTGQELAEDSTDATVALPSNVSLTMWDTPTSSDIIWISNTQLFSDDPSTTEQTIIEALTQRLDAAMDKKFMGYFDGFTVGKQTAGSATAITAAEFLAFMLSPRASLRPSMGIVLSDTMFQLIQLLADGDGRLLNWAEDIALPTVKGVPLRVSANLATVAADALVGVNISLKAAWARVTSPRLARYVDKAKPDQVGFRLSVNAKAGAPASACRVLKMKAAG